MTGRVAVGGVDRHCVVLDLGRIGIEAGSSRILTAGEEKSETLSNATTVMLLMMMMTTMRCSHCAEPAARNARERSGRTGAEGKFVAVGV